MAIRVRNHPGSSNNNIFHHGLVKLLIDKELEKHERSWSHFLFWYSFKIEFKECEESKRKKNPTRKKAVKTRANTEAVNMSKSLSEDHHKGEVPKE